jgi:hypothetical protein
MLCRAFPCFSSLFFFGVFFARMSLPALTHANIIRRQNQRESPSLRVGIASVLLVPAQPTMHHLPASILSTGLCVNELLLDPGEQSPSLFIGGLLLLRRWHLAELNLMQHLLPTLRDGNVGAYLQRQIIEPTITLLHITIVAVEAIARKEGVGFEWGGVCGVEGGQDHAEEKSEAGAMEWWSDGELEDSTPILHDSISPDDVWFDSLHTTPAID